MTAEEVTVMARARRRTIQPDSLHVTVWKGHTLYSHVVAAEGRRLIFVSGQVPFDRDGSIVGPGDMRAQIRQVGENVKAALEAAGASLDDLVKTTTYTTDIVEFFKHADVRAEYFAIALPTSTTVEVRRLARKEFMVEVEAIAIVD